MKHETIVAIIAFLSFTIIACVASPTVFRITCVSDGMKAGYKAESIKELCQ